MSVSRAILTAPACLLALTACTAEASDQSGTIEAAVAGTLQAMVTVPPPTETLSPSQTPVPSNTPIPTETETPTPAPLLASVSSATNCRTGPGTLYGLVTSVMPGEVAEVVARSDAEGYWYVANPSNPNEYCWLWGEYATVDGDTSALPVFTPEPSPTPRIGFTAYLYGFFECGEEFVVLTVVNDSGATFMSGRTRVDDITESVVIHGPRVDRHPFAQVPHDCPPDHSNFFPPGAAAFLVLPLKSYKDGNDAMATIKLCTKDNAGGDCVTNVAYFRLPDD
ncbi:MAG: hypothetical protein ACE5JF_01985 [Anaerolineales bacterium]